MPLFKYFFRRINWLLWSVLMMTCGLKAQSLESSSNVSILFYNVENLFDTMDDPVFGDDEFALNGSRHWTRSRYKKKVDHLYKTIVASGRWDPPDIIGLCEVENRQVLNDLFRETPLSKYHYEIIHYDSDDERGIDVALIVRNEKLNLIDHDVLKPELKHGGQLPTRDILHTRLQIVEDTLHVFVNHWPSRRSGITETIPLRMEVADLLKKTIDSIQKKDPVAKVIVMGDFNDGPHNESLRDALQVAFWKDETIQANRLYGWSGDGQNVPGTYKYQGRWYTFDQFFVSGTLFLNTGGIRVNPASFQIVSPDFLLMEDELYLGIKPFPTYYGFQYMGGFSDHLPIRLGLTIR